MNQLNVVNGRLSFNEMKRMMIQKHRIESIISVPISEIIHGDLESFLDLISELATGSTALMDIKYEAVAVLDVHHIAFKVTGDASGIIDFEEEELKDHLYAELEGLYNFKDGYTPEEAAQFTFDVTNILIQPPFNLPVRLVMNWGRGESQLLALVSNDNQEEAAHEVTMPYTYFDVEAGEEDPLEQFMSDILALV